jgi:hypothetical protein
MFNLSLFALLSAVVEKAVMPLANSPPPSWNRNAVDAPPTAAKPARGKKELTDALLTAERTAIIFDADLGTASVGNKDRLAHVFSSTVKAKAIAVAEEKKGTEEEVVAVVAEAVRAADDALSCASDMCFLVQSTKAYANKRDVSDPRKGTFFTMPIKLEFPDKSSRMHFERVMREKCKIKAAMSHHFPLVLGKRPRKFARPLLRSFPANLSWSGPNPMASSSLSFTNATGIRNGSGTRRRFRSPSVWSCPSRTSPWRARFASSSYSCLSPS